MKKSLVPLITLLITAFSPRAHAQVVYLDGYTSHHYVPQSYQEQGYYGQYTGSGDHVYSRRRVYSTTTVRPVYTRGYSTYPADGTPGYWRSNQHRTNRGLYINLFGN